MLDLLALVVLYLTNRVVRYRTTALRLGRTPVRPRCQDRVLGGPSAKSHVMEQGSRRSSVPRYARCYLDSLAC